MIAPEGFDFGVVRVLFRAPDALTLWGVPYEPREGQQPGDLYRADWRGTLLPYKRSNSAPEDWVYLGEPGWFCGDAEQHARARGYVESLAEVPGNPWEWCRVELKVFTFYCGVHFWEVKQGPPPSSKAAGKPMSPFCPTCHTAMFWVPDGGTKIPTEQSCDF